MLRKPAQAGKHLRSILRIKLKGVKPLISTFFIYQMEMLRKLQT